MSISLNEGGMQNDHTYDDKTDEELVAHTLSDPNRYEYIMARYEPKLMRYVLRLAAFSKEEADDVLQETFIKTYQNLNEYDRSFKFSSWIYRIAHNEAVNALRKMNRLPRTIESKEQELIMERLAGSLDLEHELDNKLHREQLLKALEKLDGKYRDVLVLKFLEEKSYEEISDILKKPVGTVGTLINRARKQLFEKINHE